MLGSLLDQTLALLQGLGVLAFLLVEDLFDCGKPLLPVGVVQALDVHLDQFSQWQLESQLLHQAQGATDDEPCQIAGLDI